MVAGLNIEILIQLSKESHGLVILIFCSKQISANVTAFYKVAGL